MADTDRSSEALCQARGQDIRARTTPFPHLMRDRKETSSIGHPQGAAKLYFWPKLVSVKRRERPERLLSQAKRVSDATANEGNGVVK